MELPADVKTLVDIGLGGVSLLLWMRQGKVNRQQMALDAKQNQTSADLTIMVKDHEARIKYLEEHPSMSRRHGRGKQGR